MFLSETAGNAQLAGISMPLDSRLCSIPSTLDLIILKQGGASR
jgi:hypothetical protein